jgi:hypothetical protein
MKKILIEEEEEIILPKKVIGKKEIPKKMIVEKELPKKMIVEKELPNVQPEPVKEEVRRYPGYYEIRPFEPLPSIEIKEFPKVERPKVERPKAEKPKVIARPLEGTPYYVLDKSCVIIDKATCLVIGYWYNGKLVEKQNQDVLDMCRRYNLHFFHPSLLIW